MAKLSTLVDTFDSGPDDAKWTYYGTVAVSGGVLNLSGPDGSELRSKGGPWDGTAVSVTAQLIRRSGDGDTQTNIVFESPTGGTTVRFTFNAGNNGLLKFENQTGYTDNTPEKDTTALTYDPDVHKYFRAREAGGTLYLEWATDPASGWTLGRSIPTPGWWGAISFFVLSTDNAATTSAQFDNLNTTASSGGTGSGSTGSQEQPIWRDEFDALSLASDSGGGSWRTKGYESGGLSVGYQDYAGSSWNMGLGDIAAFPAFNPFAVADSVLTITARRASAALLNYIHSHGGDNNIKWAGGYLVSNHLPGDRGAPLTWRYGYFEIRARFPNPARGMFPAIWLFNNIVDAQETGDQVGHAGAEIDLLEIFGHATGTPFNSGIHFQPSGYDYSYPADPSDPKRAGHGVSETAFDATQWHRYALEWTATGIHYYLDGVEIPVNQSTITSQQIDWYHGANLGIRLNYAVDPNWRAGSEDYSTDTDPPAGTEPRMEIDYVRVFAAKPSVMATGSDDPLSVVANPLASTLVDTFSNSGSVPNSAVWADLNAAHPSVISDGRLVVPDDASTLAGVQTLGAYRLDTFSVGTIVPGTQLGDAKIVSAVSAATPGTEYRLTFYNGKIIASDLVGGTDNTPTQSVTLPGASSYGVRFRTTNTNVIAELSTDGGTTWTTVRSYPLPAWIDAVKFTLGQLNVPTDTTPGV